MTLVMTKTKNSTKRMAVSQGTAPALVLVTLVFFGLFSHTLKIRPTLNNTLLDIMPSLFLIMSCFVSPLVDGIQQNHGLSQTRGLARGFLV